MFLAICRNNSQVIITFALINNTEKNRSRIIQLLHEYSPSQDGRDVKVLFRLRPFHVFKELLRSKGFLQPSSTQDIGVCVQFMQFTREPASLKKLTKALFRVKIWHDVMLSCPTDLKSAQNLVLKGVFKYFVDPFWKQAFTVFRGFSCVLRQKR